MISRAERKAVAALRRKKERRERKAFVVEGDKSVRDLLASDWPAHMIYATPDWNPPPDLDVSLQGATDGEMADMSSLDSPQSVLAVVRLVEREEPDPTRGRWLWLDGIRDPGNLGAILRVADWFGLRGVGLSPDCVDWTNPKVVQASMGSLFRVPLLSRDLVALFAEHPSVWRAGTFLEGDPLFHAAPPEDGWIVVGNEAGGIRPPVAERLSRRLTIPRFGGAESLNAAMAAAVVCAEWRR